jgi:hypothetical protein
LAIELISATPNEKSIRYEFRISRESTTSNEASSLSDKVEIASGVFTVACCRFPDDRLPYAILIPEWIAELISMRGRETLA